MKEVEFKISNLTAVAVFTDDNELYKIKLKGKIPRGYYYSTLNFAGMVLDDVIAVDGQRTNVEEFIKTNILDPDVNHISQDQLQSIIDLEKGESIYLETVKIEKLS